MKTITESIEAVCWKRHARMMSAGLTEGAAASNICMYLKHLINETWKNNNHIKWFCKNLLSGFEVQL